jgi:adenosylcobinamide kinase/adenosylcobinamide-phosphate guanylyltransferase
VPGASHAGAPITLVLGGARSGKSAFAEDLVSRAALVAGASTGPTAYLATGAAADEGMADRIRAHQERRGAGYETVECGPALVDALTERSAQAVLVDSLGTWVAAHRDFVVDAGALVDALRSRSAATVLVSEEVGLGVSPSTALGNQFRDVLGLVNQTVATVADDVWFVMAGRGLRLEAP